MLPGKCAGGEAASELGGRLGWRCYVAASLPLYSDTVPVVVRECYLPKGCWGASQCETAHGVSTFGENRGTADVATLTVVTRTVCLHTGDAAILAGCTSRRRDTQNWWLCSCCRKIWLYSVALM